MLGKNYRPPYMRNLTAKFNRKSCKILDTFNL